MYRHTFIFSAILFTKGDNSNDFLFGSLGNALRSEKDFLLRKITRGSNGYVRIDVRFPEKSDKSVQTRLNDNCPRSIHGGSEGENHVLCFIFLGYRIFSK